MVHSNNDIKKTAATETAALISSLFSSSFFWNLTEHRNGEKRSYVCDPVRTDGADLRIHCDSLSAEFVSELRRATCFLSHNHSPTLHLVTAHYRCNQPMSPLHPPHPPRPPTRPCSEHYTSFHLETFCYY